MFAPIFPHVRQVLGSRHLSRAQPTAPEAPSSALCCHRLSGGPRTPQRSASGFAQAFSDLQSSVNGELNGYLGSNRDIGDHVQIQIQYQLKPPRGRRPHRG